MNQGVVVHVNRSHFEVVGEDRIAINWGNLVALTEKGTRRDRLTLVEIMIQLNDPVVAVTGLRGWRSVVRAGCRTGERCGRPQNGKQTLGGRVHRDAVVSEHRQRLRLVVC